MITRVLPSLSRIVRLGFTIAAVMSLGLCLIAWVAAGSFGTALIVRGSNLRFDLSNPGLRIEQRLDGLIYLSWFDGPVQRVDRVQLPFGPWSVNTQSVNTPNSVRPPPASPALASPAKGIGFVTAAHHGLPVWALWLPYSAVARVSYVLPTLWILAALTRLIWRRRPHTAGSCPVCGYDLRATPDRCPECGALPRNSLSLDDNADAPLS